jgi:hypothetical protein
MSSIKKASIKSPFTAAQTRQMIREHESAIQILKNYLSALSDVQALQSENGTSATTVSKRNPAQRSPAQPAPAHHSPVSVPLLGISTGLKKRVRGLAPKLTQEWTFDDALQHLPGTARTSLRDAVRSLRNDGVVEVVEEGKGGRPSKYRFK